MALGTKTVRLPVGGLKQSQAIPKYQLQAATSASAVYTQGIVANAGATILAPAVVRPADRFAVLWRQPWDVVKDARIESLAYGGFLLAGLFLLIGFAVAPSALSGRALSPVHISSTGDPIECQGCHAGESIPQEIHAKIDTLWMRASCLKCHENAGHSSDRKTQPTKLRQAHMALEELGTCAACHGEHGNVVSNQGLVSNTCISCHGGPAPENICRTTRSYSGYCTRKR